MKEAAARSLGFALAFCLAGMAALAQSPITVTLDPKNAGPAIPEDYLGLSFETEKILEGRGGHYFSPTNHALIATIRTLGIRNLRIGGNTSDRATVKLPVEADVDQLFAFAKAADVKVIYTLRLKQGDAKAAAVMAKYIQDRYAAQLDCFAIGNEPSAYGKEYLYPIYREEWKKIMDAVVAAVPAAKFCGANVHTKPEWARDFAADFGPSGRIALITEHYYPGGSAYLRSENNAAALTEGERPTRVPKDPAMGRAQMLSGDWLPSYQKLHDGFVPFIRSRGLPYRMEEVNNFFHGGLKGASDSYASALWALEFLHWWAAHDCAGLNFHTGDVVAAGARNTACRYATFLTAPGGGYEIQPIGYAIKAFSLGSRGKRLPVNLDNVGQLKVVAYAVADADQTVVTIINKEHGPAGREAAVTLVPGAEVSAGEAMFLAAPNGDLSVMTGITLGGSGIGNDAVWRGTWTPLAKPENGKLTVKVPAASAAIVRLK